MPGVGDLPPLFHIQGIAAAGSVRRQGAVDSLDGSKWSTV
jgi:hypothetical protein